MTNRERIDYLEIELNGLTERVSEISVQQEEGNQRLMTITEMIQRLLLEGDTHAASSSAKLTGHIISHDGVAADPDKIAYTVDWPSPTSIKGLWGFLWLTGYYRKFVRDYGKISAPLTRLLKKGAFTWDTEAELAFQALKIAMTTAPILAVPDFTKSFCMKCDACGFGIGGVLMQVGRSVAFTSKVLAARHLGLSTYEEEMLAILHAVSKWRPYLLGRYFQIVTDPPLKGRENVAADALSRKHEDVIPAVVSFPVVSWLDDIKADYQANADLQSIVRAITVDPSSFPRHSMIDRLLRYKGCIVLSLSSLMCTEVLQFMHSSLSAGHSGFLKTYKRLSRSFYWKGMKHAV
ncbi:hypothetical protein HHK36_027138 [Tetracentron sinense]|uniref:Reverse transcriptase/retrotransposon-derived protein RNase H-like domain-containing protein n=1 Tax=Tetracentron sinense TaxID=13715 RepID=A0A834YJY6_TETSI|nr:hypothetical protein HHK36_027138 [Tetracentron sinense]